MMNLLDISDMNRRLMIQRRHLAARRALLYLAYCALCVCGGFILGMLAATVF
jgi:hypothetical protein